MLKLNRSFYSRVLTEFGGLHKMAKTFGVLPDTVKKWGRSGFPRGVAYEIEARTTSFDGSTPFDAKTVMQKHRTERAAKSLRIEKGKRIDRD